MNGPAELSNLVLTRRLADGTIEWIPLGIPQRIPTASGEAYALIDRANYEAPQKLVAQRQGDDLLVEVSSTEVLVLGGFFAMPGAAFYPTPDIAGGAGPFSGPKLHPESPLLEGYPAGEQLVWSAEPAPIDEPGAVVDPGSSAGSPLLWGGLAAGALGVAAIAGGGGGGARE